MLYFDNREKHKEVVNQLIKNNEATLAANDTFQTPTGPTLPFG